MHFSGTVWRPPYEAASLLIQATAGCTHHACKFCTLYDELPFKFRMSPLSEVEEDLAEAKKYVRRVNRIFFVGLIPLCCELTSSRLWLSWRVNIILIISP